MDQDPQPKVKEVLEAHRGEKHIAVLHSFPDPDAISSAYAHRLIASEYDIDVTITYTGKISHRQNIALVKLLGIELTPYTNQMDMHQFQGAVFIDNQGSTVEEIVQAIEAASVPVLLVVDHHEPQERFRPECTDIRRVGATATIYADYLQHGVIPMDNGRRDIVTMATALMHGILTDTNNFTRAGAEDFQAAGFLSRFRDADIFGQILSQSRSKAVMELIRRALGDRLVVENFSIAGIGYLRSEDRDAIPQATDFLLTEENVHTAIVYGIVRENDSEETLIGSMRTAKITVDPDEFLKEVFGKSKEGRFYGGGKTAAGGFNIPLGFLAGDGGEKFQDIKWQVYDAQIKRKILEKIGAETQVLERAGTVS
jgi:nanoRNase/pAp phosphatase (c-di-AMP/oligoRNAs hydrolase)